MDGSWMFSLPGKIHLSAGIHRFIFDSPGKSRILTNQQYSKSNVLFVQDFSGILTQPHSIFFGWNPNNRIRRQRLSGSPATKTPENPSVDFRVGLENLQVMWSDLVQGKPELDDSLSSNAKQMKVASRCFSFWFPDEMFVCFSFLGKDSPEKKAKHRKGLQGQNKGATKDDDEAFVGLGDFFEGWMEVFYVFWT